MKNEQLSSVERELGFWFTTRLITSVLPNTWCVVANRSLLLALELVLSAMNDI
jgi:hypothetical protein